MSTLTGYYSAARALEYYFNVMNEVFHYDQDDRKLYLLVDYFHGSSLRDLKPFLPDEFQQIFTGIGKVVALDNAKATVEFRYEKKFIKRAQLYKENCHCPLPEIGVGVSVNFTAILDQSVMVGLFRTVTKMIHFITFVFRFGAVLQLGFLENLTSI